MKFLRLFLSTGFILFIYIPQSHAQRKCAEGYHYDRLSANECVQSNCWTVDPPHSHFDSTSHCVCGSDDCKADPVCHECKDERGLLIDCVTDKKLCPPIGGKTSAAKPTQSPAPPAQAQHTSNIAQGMGSSIGGSIKKALDALDEKMKQALERIFPGLQITETEWFFKDDESWGYLKFRGIAHGGYEVEGKIGSFYCQVWPWTDGIKLQANLVELQDFSFGGGGLYVDWGGEHVSIDLDIPETGSSIKITPWDYYDRVRRFVTEDVREFFDQDLDLIEHAREYQREHDLNK